MYFKASCIGLQMRAQSAAHRSLDETLWRVMCRADLQCCAVGSCTGQCEQQCPATKVKSRFLLFQFVCLTKMHALAFLYIQRTNISVTFHTLGIIKQKHALIQGFTLDILFVRLRDEALLSYYNQDVFIYLCMLIQTHIALVLKEINLEK